MRSGVRSWEITHEPGPGHVTPVGGKRQTRKSLKWRRVGEISIIEYPGQQILLANFWPTIMMFEERMTK